MYPLHTKYLFLAVNLYAKITAERKKVSQCDGIIEEVLNILSFTYNAVLDYRQISDLRFLAWSKKT